MGFLLACASRGILDIRLSVHSDYLIGSYRREEPKELPMEGIAAYCMAGATDGKHREIAFEYYSYEEFVGANALLKLLIEVSDGQ